MKQTDLHNYDFHEAVRGGKVTDRSGYHQPGSGLRGTPRCGCDLTTDKGAYRDVTVEVGEITVHFYHQSSVVVTDGDRLRLDSHGYRTRSTKQRINSYLPSGFKLVQSDFDWYIKTWDPESDYDDREYETREFEDGMVIQS